MLRTQADRRHNVRFCSHTPTDRSTPDVSSHSDRARPAEKLALAHYSRMVYCFVDPEETPAMMAGSGRMLAIVPYGALT